MTDAMRFKPTQVTVKLGETIGSPGMAMANRRDPYHALLVLSTGAARVYQSYR